MNKASVVLCRENDSNAFIVLRRKATNKIALIGGKAESGETPKETAIREFDEETGLQLWEDNLVEFFAAEDHINGSFFVTAFYVPTGINNKSFKLLEPEDRFTIDLATREQLCSDESEYSEYNKKMFDMFDQVEANLIE